MNPKFIRKIMAVTEYRCIMVDKEWRGYRDRSGKSEINRLDRQRRVRM